MGQISYSVDASVLFTFVPVFCYAVLETDTNSCHGQATLTTPTKMCVQMCKKVRARFGLYGASFIFHQLAPLPLDAHSKHPPWGSNPRPQGEGPCALPTELGGLVTFILMCLIGQSQTTEQRCQLRLLIFKICSRVARQCVMLLQLSRSQMSATARLK